jgi:hypothetical protein
VKEQPAISNYMKLILEMPVPPPGVYRVEVAHEDDCAFWNGGDIQKDKACDCRPVLTETKVAD